MKPVVVVLAAPSGGGKTTIARALVARWPERYGFSVSATTRPPRQGERDGEDYFFLSKDEFRRRQAAGDFLEWAEYAGELYGTLKAEVDRALAVTETSSGCRRQRDHERGRKSHEVDPAGGEACGDESGREDPATAQRRGRGH